VRVRYSVVIPIRDEEETLAELYRRLSAVLDTLDAPWELILVDDGSVDGSHPAMLALRERDARVKIVRLSRNFGHQVAITAGLDRSSGDAVIVMDGDLQHPPEVIPELVERWQAGFEVVYGVMAERHGETRFKRWTAKSFYGLLGRLSDVEVPAAGDFRLVDRKAADAFGSLRERSRYVRGMFSWIGFRQTGVRYSAPARYAGRSKYTVPRMAQLGANGILSFSRKPLRLVLVLGFFVSALAIAEAVYAVVDRLGGFNTAPGWASLVLVVSLLGGIQLIVLGVIGEYVGLVYEEVKRRPIYVVSELHGFEPVPESEPEPAATVRSAPGPTP
jgi:glycosyltransferase involved in cell wall biosynthesis